MSIHITIDDLIPCVLPIDTEQTVIATLTNYGYLMYTINMLKSLQPFGIKVLVVCIDNKSSVILKSLGYNVICIANSNLGKFCPWNSKGYDKICYLKLELIYRILSLNVNILLVDGDIVFRKNPMNDIIEWHMDKKYDVWIQNDSQKDSNTENMCTGYMFIRASKQLCTLYDCVSEEGVHKYMKCAFDNNDQSYFNTFVKPLCRMNALPLEKYPNGKMFYENVDTLLDTAVLVHFNWVHGHIKMAKMKEHKMWILTDEDEDIL